MIEFYPDIRLMHITAAFTSGGLFLLRGLMLFAGARWARAAPVRYLSYSLDTVLLTAAMMLTSIVRQYPIAHAWLTVKVLLLAVYIALGIVAFWTARTWLVRVGSWFAALVFYAYIYSVARAHHPLGFLRGVTG